MPLLAAILNEIIHRIVFGVCCDIDAIYATCPLLMSDDSRRCLQHIFSAPVEIDNLDGVIISVVDVIGCCC